MNKGNDILSMVKERSAQAERAERRGCVLQPGALGDCILTLPLIHYLSEHLCPGGVDVLGHTDYLGILPGRSKVDSVRSMEYIEMHRLFRSSRDFEVAEHDSLVRAFAGYEWIVSFLGEQGGDFEQNLLFTAHCSQGADVITLPMKPRPREKMHVAEYYLRRFVQESQLELSRPELDFQQRLIKARKTDISKGRELLGEVKVNESANVAVVHPGAGGMQKCWCVDNFVGLAGRLREKGFEPVFVLGPAEEQRFARKSIEKLEDKSLCLRGLKLSEVLAVISAAECYAGNDSGVTHLAGAMGVRTAVVFGPTDSELYRPLGPHVEVFAGQQQGFCDGFDEPLQGQIADYLAAGADCQS